MKAKLEVAIKEKDMQTILTAIRKRIKLYEKRIKEQEEKYKPLMHKSMRVRQVSGKPIMQKKHYFSDKKTELELVLSFLEGNMSDQDFINDGINDKLSSLLDAIF